MLLFTASIFSNEDREDLQKPWLYFSSKQLVDGADVSAFTPSAIEFCIRST